ALGAAMFFYERLSEPVPEPTFEPAPRPSVGPPPKLEVVGGRSYQFGDMLLGSKGSHSWEFKNVGAGPLEVWLEETTCSCTVATLKSAEGGSGQRITNAPGQAAPVKGDREAPKAGPVGPAGPPRATHPA